MIGMQSPLWTGVPMEIHLITEEVLRGATVTEPLLPPPPRPEDFLLLTSFTF